MDAKNRTGVYRRDYHRPNRKENKSMHRTSFGCNVPVSHSASVSTLQIPNFSREGLIQRALADWKDHHRAEWRLSKSKTSVERKCLEYIRHRQTNLDRALARLYGAAYLLAIREFCDAITDRYEWLRDECERYYNEKRRQKQFQTFKVLRRSLTSAQVEDFNAAQESADEEPLTEQEEVPLFFNSLTSLHQDRFLLLPPFLKPCEVRERRFGDNANDNWWEWEQELGLQSNVGRPDPQQGIMDNFGRTPAKKSDAWGNRVKR